MPTVSDLGRMGKAKHPGKYDKFTDAELGRMIKMANPGKYEQYVDEALEPRKPSTPPATVSKPSDALINPIEVFKQLRDEGRQAQQVPQETLDKLQEYYHPRKGRLTSWWQRIKSVSRTELVGKITDEQIAVLNMGATLEREVRERRRAEIDFQKFLLEHAFTLNQLAHSNYLVALAMDEGLTTTDSIRLRVKDKETDIDLRRKREETKIEREDFEEREHIKITVEAQQAANTFKAIAQYHNLTYDQLEEIRGRIFTLIEEEEQIENSNKSARVKSEQIDEIQEMKKMYKEILNAQRRRLVEAGNREEAEGIDAVADLISSSTTGRKTTREPLPVKKSRNGE
jgi:hypothetical protein